LRVKYAEGGWFASQKTYGEFLHCANAGGGLAEGEALRIELASELACRSKQEMLSFLEKANSVAETQEIFPF
jgi:hypothetical protein